MKFDKYNTIINSKETYEMIAFRLKNYGSFLMAWTDEDGTQFDILFTVEPNFEIQNIHLIQRGIKRTDLFVSIMGIGACGFKIENDNTHGGYYAVKLNFRGGKTPKKVGELINGVMKALKK